MKIKHMEKSGINIGIVISEKVVIKDVQSALDLIMTVQYETEAQRIVINKSAICEEFFSLGSGLAGEILQKFINYHFKLAIYGDYSYYTSQPLKDFIYESNCEKISFF